jgi:hypothetical protein
MVEARLYFCASILRLVYTRRVRLARLGGVRRGPLSYMCVGASEVYFIMGLAVCDCVFSVIRNAITLRGVVCFYFTEMCRQNRRCAGLE